MKLTKTNCHKPLVDLFDGPLGSKEYYMELDKFDPMEYMAKL